MRGVIFVFESRLQNPGKFDRGKLDAQEGVIAATGSNKRCIAPPIAGPEEDMVREKVFAIEREYGSGDYSREYYQTVLDEEWNSEFLHSSAVWKVC
jgi:hypothetical protein